MNCKCVYSTSFQVNDDAVSSAGWAKGELGFEDGWHGGHYGCFEQPDNGYERGEQRQGLTSLPIWLAFVLLLTAPAAVESAIVSVCMCLQSLLQRRANCNPVRTNSQFLHISRINFLAPHPWKPTQAFTFFKLLLQAKDAEMKHFESVIQAFLYYKEHGMHVVQKHETSFQRLPPTHQKILNYLPAKFDAQKHCLQVGAISSWTGSKLKWHYRQEIVCFALEKFFVHEQACAWFSFILL